MCHFHIHVRRHDLLISIALRAPWSHHWEIMATNYVGKNGIKFSEEDSTMTWRALKRLTEGVAQTAMLCQMVLYCVFIEALDLEPCESLPCLLNNCDSIAEAMQLSLLLCPTCMRKLHLMGVVHDMHACEAQVSDILESRGLNS